MRAIAHGARSGNALPSHPELRSRRARLSQMQHDSRRKLFQYAYRQPDRRQLESSAKANLPGNRGRARQGFGCVTAAPSPVGGQTPQDGI